MKPILVNSFKKCFKYSQPTPIAFSDEVFGESEFNDKYVVSADPGV
jgi:hypothetical protein